MKYKINSVIRRLQAGIIIPIDEILDLVEKGVDYSTLERKHSL